MFCTICQSPNRAAIIEDWASSGSLRSTAKQHDVGYRSLQRHIDLCLASILAENEQKIYEAAFRETASEVRQYFARTKRKPRPKSIVKIPVKFTWSRRAWKSRSK